MIVNTITTVLNVIKIVCYVGQLLQYLCNYVTNSPQYHRKDIVVQVSGQGYNVQIS